MSRLVSGKVEKKYGANLSADRYEFLSLDQAEPDLGVPNNFDPNKKYVVTTGGTTARGWTELNSDQISEGDTNLFFTEPRVRALFGAGKGINLSSDGVISTKGDDSGLGLYNTGVVRFEGKTPTIEASNIIVFPSNEGFPYIVYSILATNISEANLAYVTCNVVYPTKDGGTVDPTLCTNFPVASNTAFELLLKPIIFGQGSTIQARVTDENGVAKSNLLSFYVSYQQTSDRAFIFENENGAGPGGKIPTSNVETVLLNTTGDKSPLVAESLLLVNESPNSLPVSSFIRTMPSGISYQPDLPLVQYPVTAILLNKFSIPPFSSVEVFERAKAIPGDSLLTLTSHGKSGDSLSYFYGAKRTEGWTLESSRSIINEEKTETVGYNITAKNQSAGQLVFWEIVPITGTLTSVDFLAPNGLSNYVALDKKDYAVANVGMTLHVAFYEARTFALDDARQGRFEIQVRADKNTNIEGDESFEIRLYNATKNSDGSYSVGLQQAQGAKVTIEDTSNQAPVPPGEVTIYGPDYVSEGDTIRFKVSHPNRGVGTILYYRVVPPKLSADNNYFPDSNTFETVTTVVNGNVVLDRTYVTGLFNEFISGVNVSGTAARHQSILQFKTGANCVPTGNITKFGLLVSDNPLTNTFATQSPDVIIADTSAANFYAEGGTAFDLPEIENGLPVNYRYHIFTENGTFRPKKPPSLAANVDVFLIAGGGGGGGAAAQRHIASSSGANPDGYGTTRYKESGWTHDGASYTHPSGPVTPNFAYAYTGGGGGAGAAALTQIIIPPEFNGTLAITVGAGGIGGSGAVGSSPTVSYTNLPTYMGVSGRNGTPSSIVSTVPGLSIYQNHINLEVLGGGGGGSNSPGNPGGTGGGAGWGTFELGNYANQLRQGGTVDLVPENKRKIGGETTPPQITTLIGFAGGWAHSVSKDNNVNLGAPSSQYMQGAPIGYNSRTPYWSSWAAPLGPSVVHDNTKATEDFAGGGAGGGGGAGQVGNRQFGPGNPVSSRYFSGTYAPEPTSPTGFHNYLLGGGPRSSGLIYVSGFSGGNGLSISSNSWLGRLNSSLQTTPRKLIGQPLDAPLLSSLGEPTGAGGEFYIGGGGGGAGALSAAMKSFNNNYNPQGWSSTYLASGGDGGRGGGGNGAMHYSLLKGLPTESAVLNALDVDPNVSSVNGSDVGYGGGFMINLQRAEGAADFLGDVDVLGPNWDYRDLFHGQPATQFTGGGGGGAYRSGSRIGAYGSEYRLNSDGVLTENGARDSRYRADGKAGDGAPGIVILRYKA
jgi:hypothetical protein